MKRDNRFYVYAHINPLNGEVFYVGRGVGNRMYSTHNRSEFWHNIVNKYGIAYEILRDNLTNDAANQYEKAFIALYGRKENGGTLCNLTDGGDGLCGYKPTEETLQRKSKALKGRIIKPIDAEDVTGKFFSGLTINELAAIEKVSKATIRKYIPESIRGSVVADNLKKAQHLLRFSKGNIPWNKGKSLFAGEANPFYGKQHSDTSKQAMAEKKEKPVLCLTNNLTYKSTIEASQALGLNQSSVAKVARGYQKQTGGFVFKYVI